MFEDKNKEMNKDKNKLLLTIVGVLVLIVAVVGVTYAAWSYTFNGASTNTLQTADLSLELLESDDNVINITDALPMSDAQGKGQAQVFDFVVTSKTVRDIDIDYTISLEKLDADTNYTLLNDNQIKLYLTDNSGTAIWTEATNNVKKVSDLTSYQLTTGSHSHDSTHNKVQDKYRLRVWIDQDVDASSWTSSTKYQYKFRIGVSGGEHVNTPTTVYRMSTTHVAIGDTLTTGDSSPHLGDYYKWYLKHTLDSNNVVTETYVCYQVSGEEYCYQGEKTSDKASGYVSQYWTSNINMMNSSMGTNCTVNDNRCEECDERFNLCVEISPNESYYSQLWVGDTGFSCYFLPNGDSHCDFDN